MEPEGSSPCSQNPATGPYHFINKFLIFFSHLCLGLHQSMTIRMHIYGWNDVDEGSMELRNVGILPQHYTAPQPSLKTRIIRSKYVL
jgi:hypothetical protein